MKQVAALRSVGPTMLPIEWTTAINKVDSGVYLMRRMETFMGQKVNEWKCGTLRSVLSLQYLRAKMSKELLFGNSNTKMYKILHLIQQCNEEGKKKGPIDVEKMIATYTK